MKKKLVVLLAVVMMFAFSASAYAATFSDVSERSVTEQDAIKKAVALGIIEGYEDGTFGPDKTITRAEFAKIAVTAAGAKETATMLEANASAFKDVRANSWYTGWINAAESLGIFKGDTNGNFRPNDTISNQEAITVLLRLLGYNDNLTGTWPVNYVTKANQIGILDDVNIVASAAAKRGDVVVMLGEALDTPIVTYDKDTNEFVYKQTTKSGSSYITLLDDSFEGSYVEVDRFEPVNQVRNVADKTLNWNVTGRQANISENTNNNQVNKDNTSGNMIIDENTAVSHNAEGLFDLENHQGKVYYVTEGGRRYARFIEVESYIQTVTDRVTLDNNKAKVKTSTYNATKDAELSDDADNNYKNTNFSMYFNDDDQVYYVASDRDFEDKAYYVKSLTAASARLVGTKTRTVNMSDADTLIYDNGKFVSPSDLEVGDSIVEIREGELYVKVADASGDYTRTEVAQLVSGSTTWQHKATIGGKKYVFTESTTDKADVAIDSITTLNPNFFEGDLEPADVTSEDVYNNNVKFLLNKDNTIAAIIVDETSTGTTLYGVVVDGGSNGTWGKNMSSITLFTQEGYTVTYDFAKGCKGKPDGNDAQSWMGQPVSYKLDADGNIKTFNDFKGVLSDGTEEVKVKNNAYLINDAKKLSVSLASNVVIFEVGEDEHEVDVSLVSRSSLLSGGDFTPESFGIAGTENANRWIQMGFENGAAVKGHLDAYAQYETNSNNSVKAFAYTTGNSTTKYYGVVKAWRFTDADHAGYTTGNNDFAITLVGDDNVYDLAHESAELTADGKMQSGAGHFIVYTLSGDELTIVKSYGKNDTLAKSYSKQITGFNDGWIYFNPKDGVKPAIDEFNEGKVTGSANADGTVYRVMTDTNTVVYVLDSNSGEYREGSLSDISRNAYAYVPVIDEDGFAEAVLVDEYPYDKRNDNDDDTESKATFKKDITLTVEDKDGKVRFHDFKVTKLSVKSSTISFTVENNGSDKIKDVEVFLNNIDRTDDFEIKANGSGVTCTAKKDALNLKDGVEYTVSVDVTIK